MPEVDAQVVRGHVRLAVAVDGDGVDVVGVAIGEDPPGAHLHHQIHRLQHGHLRRRRGGQSKGRGDGGGVLAGTVQGHVIKRRGQERPGARQWVSILPVSEVSSATWPHPLAPALQGSLPPLLGLLGLVLNLLRDFE